MKKILRKSAVGFLTMTCMAAGAMGAILSTPNKEVTTRAATNGDMQMKTGASIYLNENSGLRFGYSVANYSAEAGKNYGMLIVPYDYLAKAEITLGAGVDYVTVLNAAYAEGTIPYAPIVAENITPVLEDGEYVVKHSIVDIIPQNYVREFFGVGFEKTGETYTYAVGNDNVRSVFEVANLALNEYEANTLPADEKQLIADNKTTVDNYITEGFDFVYSGATLANSYADADAYNPLNLEKQEGKENIDLTSQMHFTYENTDNTVATVNEEGMIKPLKYGTTTVTYSLGGVKKITQEVKILASEAQAVYSNNAEGAEFNEDGSISLAAKKLASGYISTAKNYRANYVAVENFTVGKAIDIEFKGNNMPIMRVFADAISGRFAYASADGETTDIGGALIMNGAAGTSRSDASGTAQKFLRNTDKFIIRDNLLNTNLSDTYDAVANPCLTEVDNFGLTQAELQAAPDQKYKATIGTISAVGEKIIEFTLYKWENEAWTEVGTSYRALTLQDGHYGDNLVLMSNLLEEGDSSTFTVSLPYDYEQKQAGVLASKTSTVVDNGDGTYQVTLTSKNYSGYTSYMRSGSVAFLGEYGVGTYVDVTLGANWIIFPVIHLFASDFNAAVNGSGVYFAQRYGKGNSNSTFTFALTAFYGSKGVEETTNKWAPASVHEMFGAEATQSGKYKDYTLSVGSYLNDETNTVWLEWRLYDASGVEVTGDPAYENTYDTGLAVSAFEAAPIAILPRMQHSTTVSTSTYKVKIYQKNS